MCAAAESLTQNALRVRSLILVAPVNPYSAHGRSIAAFAGTHFGAAFVRAVVERIPSLYPFWHGRMFANRARIPAGSLDGYKLPLAQPGLFEHALSIVSTWGSDLRELEALLPKLAGIPTLLMWGSKDPAVYFSSMEPLARYFPNAEKVVFPGIGHLPYEECPQEFNQALVGFLTR
jgi:pimeloyl-ACP methyl ester carboxylesterase